MKKKMLLILLASMTLTMAGCGSSKQTDTAEKQEESTTVEDSESAVTYEPVLYEDLSSKLVSLGEYKGLQAARNVQEVTEEDVQAEIDSIKKENAELVDKEEPAETGDVVNIDFTGYIDGETSDNLKAEGTDVEIGAGTVADRYHIVVINKAKSSGTWNLLIVPKKQAMSRPF